MRYSICFFIIISAFLPQLYTAGAQEAAGSTSRDPFFSDITAPVNSGLDFLEEKTNLRLGADYQALGMGGISGSSDHVYGASGYYGLSARWTVQDSGTGNSSIFDMRFEGRHDFGNEYTPTSMASALGYAGVPGVTFSDGFISKFYIRQNMFGNRLTLTAGHIDLFDHIDVIGVLAPRMAFFNGSSVLNFSMSTPGAGFATTGRMFVTDQFYLFGALGDANGDSRKVDWFSGGAEFFRYGELGWTPSQQDFLKTKLHVGFWNVDERQDAGIAGGYGFLASGNITIDDVWMPYFRAGWSDGGSSLYKWSVTTGFTYAPGGHGDLTGVAASLTRPRNIEEIQFMMESFYRFQVADNLSLTADLQWLVNPAANKVDNHAVVYGMGIRYTL